MSHHRIRRGGLEYPVSGLSALVQMVADGALGPDDRVWEPERDAWLPARDLPPLAAAFAEREALLRRVPRAAPPSDPPPAQGPSSEPPAASPFDSIPDLALEPLDPPRFVAPPDLDDSDEPRDPAPPDSPTSARGPRRATEPRGQVIRFPVPAVRPTDDSLARAYQADPFDPTPFLRAESAQPDRSAAWRVRPMVVVSTVLLGGALLLGVETHVRGQATRYFQPVQTARVVPPASPGSAPIVADGPRAPNLPEGMADFYDSMEADLRARMLPGELAIGSEDALEMALMVELSRLRIDVLRIDAPVLLWGGRKSDVPLRAEIRLAYQSQPSELDRELAAIGLVVGKYVQRYSLEVPLAEIVVQESEGPARARTLDPELARAFYLRRISLVKFLAGEESP